MVIDIPVIKDLAMTASLGVAVLGLHQPDPAAGSAELRRRQPRGSRAHLRADSAETRDRGFNRLFAVLARFVEPRWAQAAVIGSALLLVGGYMVSTQLKIGDLDPARRTAADSRYNRDNAYVTGHYTLSERHLRGDRQDRQGRLPQVPDAVEADRLAWDCSRSRVCRRPRA
jgi:hypothetical protein